MSKFAIRFGHQATGNDTAAEGIIKEYDVIRSYAPYVISGLQRLGHEVLNVTPPENHRTLSDSLMYGINKANDWGADCFISCHANCEVPTAHGCEVIYGSTAGKVIAEKIVKELNNLGFESHRGAYLDERGLSEIHKTDPIACIIEPFFISNTENVDLYNKIGPEKLGYAIVKGLTGKYPIENKTSQTGSYRVTTECFNNKEDVHYVVCYNNDVDKRSALYLSEYLGCEAIDNLNTPFDYEKYYPICVGGGNFTSYMKLNLKGTDRYKTMLEVAKYIEGRR